LVAACFLWVCGLASLPAHTPSETYLAVFLTPTNVSGQWDIAVRDLQQAPGIRSGALGTAAAVELDQRHEAYALDTIARLQLKLNDAAMALRVTDYFPVTLNKGDYLRVQFSAPLPPRPVSSVSINANVLFEIDSNLHGFFSLEHEGRTEIAAFNSDNSGCTFTLSEPSRSRQFLTFVREGVWHIWIGIDHILFLLALLFPSVLRRQEKEWAGVAAFKPALINVLKIVTAFTVAHSITLSLAALGIVTLPSRLVESAIAASVALAALNNLYPWLGGHAWMVAFGFGLIHGFGFASSLADLGVQRGTLAMGLVGFNVGVELGQLAIVAVFLPVAFALRRTWVYQGLVLKLGSALVILLSAVWIGERALNVKLLPF
jgi:hypothetical protein